MNYWNIRNERDALAYFTDCQLATVADLAMKKSRPKGEYKRHIELAQKMCDHIKQFKIKDKENRFEKVFEMGSVQAWAKKIEEGN